ncbi:MAG: hypothetical protein QG567_1960, partial [Campylobacterota bacterium]|nr:hypothetical protein [Campylobacterota bacterium]
SLNPAKESWAMVVPKISDDNLNILDDLVSDNSKKMRLE